MSAIDKNGALGATHQIFKGNRVENGSSSFQGSVDNTQKDNKTSNTGNPSSVMNLQFTVHNNSPSAWSQRSQSSSQQSDVSQTKYSEEHSKQMEAAMPIKSQHRPGLARSAASTRGAPGQAGSSQQNRAQRVGFDAPNHNKEQYTVCSQQASVQKETVIHYINQGVEQTEPQEISSATDSSESGHRTSYASSHTSADWTTKLDTQNVEASHNVISDSMQVADDSKKLGELMSKHKRIELDLKRVEAEKAQLETAKAQLETREAQLETVKAQLEEKLEQTQAEAQRLAWELEKEQRAHRQVQENNHRLVRSCSRKDLSVGDHFDDEAVLSTYKGIELSIKDWTIANYSGIGVVGDPAKASITGPEIFYISPYHKHLDLNKLQSDSASKCFFIQGLLGYIVLLSLPNQQAGRSVVPRDYGREINDCWMGRSFQDGVRGITSSFNQDALPTSGLYHDWRTLTMQLPLHSPPPSNDYDEIVKIADQILIDIPWAPTSVDDPHQDSELQLRKGLIMILEQIITLCRMTYGQRAYWTAHHSGFAHHCTDPVNGLQFSDQMKIKEQDSDRLQATKRRMKEGGVGNEVRFILFPALWKRGNADGEEYDSDVLMRKEEVLLNYQFK